MKSANQREFSMLLKKLIEKRLNLREKSIKTNLKTEQTRLLDMETNQSILRINQTLPILRLNIAGFSKMVSVEEA